MKRVYLIATIVALLVGVSTYFFAQSLIKNSSESNEAKRIVLVAASDIPAGTTIRTDSAEEMFIQKAVYVSDLAPNAVGSIEQLAGQVVEQDIYAGEQISLNRFVSAESERAGLSFSLAEGEAAVSIKAEDVQGVDGYVRVGDTIDIIARYDPKEDENGKKAEEAKTEMKFKELEVLRVATYEAVSDAKSDGTGEVKTYVSITVRTTDEQAVEIYQMENDTDGKFKLVLNSRSDAEEK